MTIRMERLEVGHVERDFRGDKIEPEAQPAKQLGHIDIMVSAGIPNEAGGPPIVTVRDLASAIGFTGQNKMAQGGIERQTTAGAAAQEITKKCVHCRSFDLDAIQSSRNLHRDRNHVELTDGFVKKGYSLPLAQATAKTVGMCSQHDKPTIASHGCQYFRARNFITRRLMSRKIDSIMRAAQGRFDEVDFKL